MKTDMELEKLYIAALNEIESGGNEKRGFRMLLLLADRGYPPAMCGIANLYSAGIGIRKDRKLAINWWRRAAGKGDATSMLNLGLEYRDRLGNLRQARHWLLKASRFGDAQADLELARLWYGRDKFRNRDKIKRYVLAALERHRSGESYLSEDELENAELLSEELKESRQVK